MSELLGLAELLDIRDFTKLVGRLSIDLVFSMLVTVGVYHRRHQNRELVFTCILFNLVTFLLCFLLRKTPIELGFALGLFAVFGILRYRTEPIQIRDLTYLFVVIGIAILNAVSNKKVSFAELMLVNSVVVGAAALLEYLP